MTDPTARAIQHVITRWNLFAVVDLAARRRQRWMAKYCRPMPPEPPRAA